jgi:membrane-bound lytic murein transglycosylase B
MQFEPSTWAAYGRGSIDSQHDAIFAAARYLVANGAPRDMADALFHYNASPEYGQAVTDYARRMQVDPRAFDGYYSWQVIFAKGREKFLLPDGYPSARPEPIW